MKKAAVVGAVLALLSGGWACALTGSQPPAVPHPTTGTYENCVSCHEDGSQGAPRTNHPRKDDCTSCHHPTKT
jgi:hypothetical protein